MLFILQVSILSEQIISIQNTRDARVIDSGTANAHRVGDSHTVTHSLTAVTA